MSLSIIIPAKDEEKNIIKTYKKVEAKLERKKINYEIIVVDDFSNDKTYQYLKKIKKKKT